MMHPMFNLKMFYQIYVEDNQDPAEALTLNGVVTYRVP